MDFPPTFASTRPRPPNNAVDNLVTFTHVFCFYSLNATADSVQPRANLDTTVQPDNYPCY